MVQLGCPHSKKMAKTKLKLVPLAKQNPKVPAGAPGAASDGSDSDDSSGGADGGGADGSAAGGANDEVAGPADHTFVFQMPELTGTGGPPPGSEFKLLTEEGCGLLTGCSYRFPLLVLQ